MRWTTFVAALFLLAAPCALHAQASSEFDARLEWVPISGVERNDVAGGGAVSATLDRSTLAITGNFAGLPANATRASLHQGIATGARGPAIADLKITKSASGEVSGAVTLSREQRDALLAGHLYLQIHAERGVPPDNAVLWGWLLPARR
jgi:hypothetical protein